MVGEPDVANCSQRLAASETTGAADGKEIFFEIPASCHTGPRHTVQAAFAFDLPSHGNSRNDQVPHRGLTSACTLLGEKQ